MQGVLLGNGCQFLRLFRVGQTGGAVGLGDLSKIPSIECFISWRDFWAGRLVPITGLSVHQEARGCSEKTANKLPIGSPPQ